MNDSKNDLFVDKPLISIITVVFNSQNLLEDTINSVINQSYDNIEYIIIDGGSTDKTLEIVKKYRDNIDYFISEPDKGIYDAMNKGILASKGIYLNFLNSGDLFWNNKIVEKVALNVSNNNRDLIYGDVFILSQNGDKLGTQKSLTFNQKNILEKGTRTVCHQSIFIKRSITPMYNLKYELKGELNWYFDIFEQKESLNMLHMDIPFTYYRLGGRGQKDFKKNLLERIQIINSRFGLRQNIKNIPNYIKYLLYIYSTKMKMINRRGNER